MTTETTGSGDITRSLELLWGTGERPSRGPKPGLTLDRIVATAVEVADAEGLGAVSMRRLSTELGTGTMSLYRYVPGKAELLDLMLDRVSDPGPCDAPGPEVYIDWRDSVWAIARGFRDLYRAHPWLLKVNQVRTVLGPSALQSLEGALTGLREIALSDAEKISVLISVQSFVTGIVRMESEAAEATEATGQSHEEFWEEQEPFLDRAMRSGRYPTVAKLDPNAFGDEIDHFDFGLRRLISGIEVLIRERGAVPPAPGKDGRRGQAS